MATITKRATLNFTPLTISHWIGVEGTVSKGQNYSAYNSEYVPDYTLTPLVLQPYVSVMQKDGVSVWGKINASLTNISWTEISDKVSTVLTDASTGYGLTTSGTNAGRLQLKKNIAANTSITLKFTAQYVDPRTQQVYQITDTVTVACSTSADAKPVLAITSGDQVIYNPWTDADKMVVTAHLYAGEDGEVSSDKRLFVWETSNDGATFHTVGSDFMDFHLEVSSDGTTCTVDRSLMGEKFYLRCRAKFSSNGTPSSVTLSDASPSAMTTFIRQLPKWWADIYGVPDTIPEGTLYVRAIAHVEDANGEVTNFMNELSPVWLGATNVSNGNPTLDKQIGYGEQIDISTSYFDKTYGMVIGLDIHDRGAWGAMTDSDGAIITDSDGAVIMIH